jgi:hypothetical protein
MEGMRPDSTGPSIASAGIGPGTGPFRILWIAGMARSGSTWVFNVARLLMQRHGVRVKPDAIIPNEADYLRIANEVTQQPPSASDPVWLFKTHLRLSGPLPGARLICTYRDPRDAMVSFQRFMRCDFERAMGAAIDMVETSDHYRRITHVPKLELEYRDITGEPEASALRIARHVGIEASPAEIAGLCRALSKPAVQELINQTDAEVRSLIETNEAVPRDRFVINSDGTARAMDPVTGFQTGHVSDYRDGDWAEILTPLQAQLVNERLGPWLKANNYA